MSGRQWPLVSYTSEETNFAAGWISAISPSPNPGGSGLSSLSVSYGCAVWMLVPGTTKYWTLNSLSYLSAYLDAHGAFTKDPVDDTFYVEGPRSGATLVVQAPGKVSAPTA